MTSVRVARCAWPARPVRPGIALVATRAARDFPRLLDRAYLDTGGLSVRAPTVGKSGPAGLIGPQKAACAQPGFCANGQVARDIVAAGTCPRLF